MRFDVVINVNYRPYAVISLLIFTRFIPGDNQGLFSCRPCNGFLFELYMYRSELLAVAGGLVLMNQQVPGIDRQCLEAGVGRLIPIVAGPGSHCNHMKISYTA